MKRPFFVLIIAGCCALLASEGFAQMARLDRLRVSQDRIEARIKALSRFGANPEGGVSRVAFSEADIQGREYIMSLMREAGLTVLIDAAGNIIGRREGRRNDLPPIMFGSHIDSVPKGGNYDGDVGVIGAIEVAQVLYENKVVLDHPIEVIVFSDEEGGLVGSRAIIGELSEEALDVVSHSGKSIREGIRAIGGDPDRLDTARRHKGDIAAFIELHIEQGSILDDEGVQIGVVEGIVGINWWEVTIEGFANHAGTTPMNKRRDALLAAAHMIIGVNRVVTETPGRQVGTVGRIKAEPGAPNVIPGKVGMSLEIRDLSAEKIQLLFRAIQSEAERIARQTGTKITFTPIDVTAVPAPTDERVRAIIAESAEKLGLSYKFMPSGAGHDAQDMARIAPTGMIFIPSVGGISHSPKEYSRPEDMANGANVLLHTVLKLDRGVLR
ncbi:MAG: M20 family metallo-hydrolase [candidate division KSB1 bacterium]|nr:M20 family metallo-hydrolase [candidate division KSB1 bacterium]MDQ7063685.1 M20 family metallo-hydrolase [candidate division KSB1 bacterium]